MKIVKNLVKTMEKSMSATSQRYSDLGKYQVQLMHFLIQLHVACIMRSDT